MGTERFDLANGFQREYAELVADYLEPKDISVAHGAPDFDMESYATSPDSVAHTECPAIYIAGDAADKKRWIDVLPTLTGLRRVMLNTTAISMPLMNAVCRHGGIERLQFGSTRLDNLAPLAQLAHLTHLSVGSSPRISSLQPIGSLSELVSLCILGNFPKLQNLDDLGGLEQLRGILLCGQDYKALRLANLEVLRHLNQLEYVGLTAVRVESGGLSALCELERLEFLALDPFQLHVWSRKDIQMIHEAHPGLKGTLIRRVATEPELAKTLGVR